MHQDINLKHFYGSFEVIFRDTETLNISVTKVQRCLFKTHELIGTFLYQSDTCNQVWRMHSVIILKGMETFFFKNIVYFTCEIFVMLSTNPSFFCCPAVCGPEGVVSVVTSTAMVLPQMDPNRTSLLDSRCRPEETDNNRMLFVFTVDTCGTKSRVGSWNLNALNNGCTQALNPTYTHT